MPTEIKYADKRRGIFDNEVRAFAIKSGKHLPHGIVLTDEELPIWKECIGARKADEWRDVDLQQLHQLVQLEVRIRYIWKQIMLDGELVLNAKGEPVVNPLLGIHKNYMLLKQKLMGSLSIPLQPALTANVQQKSLAEAKQDFVDEHPPLLALQ